MLKANKKSKIRKEKMMRKGAILDLVGRKVFSDKVAFEKKSRMSERAN